MAAYRRVYDSRHLQADCQEPGSSFGTIRSIIEYWLPLPLSVLINKIFLDFVHLQSKYVALRDFSAANSACLVTAASVRDHVVCLRAVLSSSWVAPVACRHCMSACLDPRNALGTCAWTG